MEEKVDPRVFDKTSCASAHRWSREPEARDLESRKEGCSDKARTIARNVAIDHLRKRTPISLDEMRDSEDAAPFEPVAVGPSPFEQVAAIEDKVRIQAALDQLPPIFREVLVLRFQEQMKLEEIAKLINIPLATVKTRIYRGVVALRPALMGGAQ